MEAVAKRVGPRSGEIWCGVHFLIFSVYDHPVFWRSLRFCLKSCKIQDEKELAPYFAENCCEADHIRKEQVAVSQVTKRALEQSLKNLLLKKPLTKITINDIAEDCGINRMTFYYHFKDIYDLVEWSCLEDAKRALDEKKTYETWQQGFLQIFEAVQDNKPFILNVYRCVHREQVEKYLRPLVDRLLLDVINEEVGEMKVRDEDKQFIAQIYSYIFIGLMLDWIKDDMREDRSRSWTGLPGLSKALCQQRSPVSNSDFIIFANLIIIFTLCGSVIRLLSRSFFCLL